MENLPFTPRGSSEPVVVEPTLLPVENITKNLITIRYSYYKPWVGGTNCASFVNGQYISKMSSGYAWEDYIDLAIACPPEMSFGTRLDVFGQEWICLDRGGAIQYVDGIPWIDFLTGSPKAPYGSLVEAILIP